MSRPYSLTSLSPAMSTCPPKCTLSAPSQYGCTSFCFVRTIFNHAGVGAKMDFISSEPPPFVLGDETLPCFPWLGPFPEPSLPSCSNPLLRHCFCSSGARDGHDLYFAATTSVSTLRFFYSRAYADWHTGERFFIRVRSPTTVRAARYSDIGSRPHWRICGGTFTVR